MAVSLDDNLVGGEVDHDIVAEANLVPLRKGIDSGIELVKKRLRSINLCKDLVGVVVAVEHLDERFSQGLHQLAVAIAEAGVLRVTAFSQQSRILYLSCREEILPDHLKEVLSPFPDGGGR